MIMETIPQLASLTREQKSCLAFELWDAAVAGGVPLTPEQEARIDEGLAAYKANPDAVYSSEQVAERLRRLKRQIKEGKQ
jgi:putative addiction module component (TIGR02574 family)